MNDQAIINLLSFITFVGFMIAMVFIMIKQFNRVLRIKRNKQKVPSALKRDIYFWTLISIIILSPLANNVLTGENLSGNIWWVLIRSIAALGAVGVWLYYEVRMREQ